MPHTPFTAYSFPQESRASFETVGTRPTGCGWCGGSPVSFHPEQESRLVLSFWEVWWLGQLELLGDEWVLREG